MIGTVNLLIVVWGLQMITPAYPQILNSTTTYNRTDHEDYPISPDNLNDAYHYLDGEEIRDGRNHTTGLVKMGCTIYCIYIIYKNGTIIIIRI